MKPTSLGEARFDSPLQRVVSEQARIPSQLARDPSAPAQPELWFELAGPRAKLFFEPQRTRAAIVTCRGLSPGMNNVIRSLFLELHHCDGVRDVLGFGGGYQGLDPSRGPVDIAAAV